MPAYSSSQTGIARRLRIDCAIWLGACEASKAALHPPIRRRIQLLGSTEAGPGPDAIVGTCPAGLLRSNRCRVFTGEALRRRDGGGTEEIFVGVPAAAAATAAETPQ